MTGRLRPQTGLLRPSAGASTPPHPSQRAQTGTLGRPDEVELPVVVLTSMFQVRGRMWIRGVIQTYLGNDQKHTLSIYNAEVLGLENGNPAARMSQPEVVINKPSASVILLEVRPPEWAMPLMPRSESLVAYTNSFAVMGLYHLPADGRVQDFAALYPTDFVLALEVKIFPLFQARAGLVQTAPVALVHKRAINLFHAI